MPNLTDDSVMRALNPELRRQLHLPPKKYGGKSHKGDIGTSPGKINRSSGGKAHFEEVSEGKTWRSRLMGLGRPQRVYWEISLRSTIYYLPNVKIHNS